MEEHLEDIEEMNKDTKTYAKLGLSDMIYKSTLEEINLMVDLDQLSDNNLKHIKDLLMDTHATLDMILDKIAKKL
jgi:hypothetical protein